MRKKGFLTSHAKSSAALVSLGIHAVLIVIALSFVAVTVMASAVTNVVYQDDFSGSSSSNLIGTTTDVGGGVWTSTGASASFKADGGVTGGGSGIWLPVTIEAGNIYTLSGEITQPVANNGWISLGYAQNNPDDGLARWWLSGRQREGGRGERADVLQRIYPFK